MRAEILQTLLDPVHPCGIQPVRLLVVRGGVETGHHESAGLGQTPDRRGVVLALRSPEEADRQAGAVADHRGGGVEFFGQLPGAEAVHAVAERRVVPGVVADDVTGGDHLLQHLGGAGHPATDHEEGGMHVVPGEDLQDLRGPDRARPVVEGQGDRSGKGGGGVRDPLAGRPWTARGGRRPGRSGGADDERTADGQGGRRGPPGSPAHVRPLADPGRRYRQPRTVITLVPSSRSVPDASPAFDRLGQRRGRVGSLILRSATDRLRRATAVHPRAGLVR